MVSRRSYSEAIDALNGLQSNAAVIDAIRKSGGKGGDVQLNEQLEYMKRIGYAVSHLSLPRLVSWALARLKDVTRRGVDSFDAADSLPT